MKNVGGKWRAAPVGCVSDAPYVTTLKVTPAGEVKPADTGKRGLNR